MQYKVLFSACAAVALMASTSAFAVGSDHEGTTMRHTAYRHHVARNHNPGVVSDVPQETAAPEIKPQTAPEYFGHAEGSDGSMPQ